jgi:hypothetical protein
MIPIDINGIRTLVKDIKPIGDPYVRGGEIFQDAEVTLYEPLRYFTVTVEIDDGHDGSEL